MGKVCCVDGLKCVILKVCSGIRIQRFARAYSTVAPEPTTATNGTWRELEPTSNATAYLTISAIFAAQLVGPEMDRPNDQSAPLAVPSAVLRYNASSLRRGRPQVWPATDFVLGRTGEGGAGGPVVAGGPRGGWPPADTGIVLPEYSTPRYRDLLPPRLGGWRQAHLASPEKNRRSDHSSASREVEHCRLVVSLTQDVLRDGSYATTQSKAPKPLTMDQKPAAPSTVIGGMVVP